MTDKERLLSKASTGGSTYTVETLLHQNVDPNTKDEEGDSPLIRAIWYNENIKIKEEIVSLLIEHGADVNMEDKDGTSPLQLSIIKENICLVKKLLENKADPNMKHISGSTPLHVAMVNIKDPNYLDQIMDQLIKHGADVNIGDARGLSSLHYAISNENFCMVKKLLETKADPNMKHNSGNTCLHHAMINVEDPNCLDQIADQLIKHGADVNIGDAREYSPLHLAIEKGNVCMVKKLLENRADPNKKDNLKNTSLHLALVFVKYTKTLEQIVSLLIDHEADVNIGDADGFSPLEFAVQRSPYVVKKLMENGADPNLKGTKGISPLNLAIIDGNYCIVKNLLQHGADPNMMMTQCKYGPTTLILAILNIKDHNLLEEIVEQLIEHGADVNLRDEKGNSPLHAAASVGNYFIIEKLLEEGTDPNLKDKHGGFALYYAILHVEDQKCLEEIVELLIANGADVNLQGVDLALHYAAEKGKVCIVKKLLENGADPNMISESGDTALHCAINKVEDQKSHEQVVDLLIEHGANVNLTDEDGGSLLHLAAQNRNLGIVKKLLENGADPNMKDIIGNCALHLAVNYEEIVDQFIAHNANVNVINKLGQTPLHMAAYGCNMNIVRKLLQRGADHNALDIKGRTPLHLAVLFRNQESILLLINYGADVQIKDDNCQPGASYFRQCKQNVTFGEFCYSWKYLWHAMRGADLNLLNCFDICNENINFHTLKEILLHRSPQAFSNYAHGLNILLCWLSLGSHIFKQVFLQKLSFLLEHTVDLEQRDYQQRNFLHLCFSITHEIFDETQSKNIYVHLSGSLAKYINKSLVNAKDHNGWTPSHLLLCSFALIPSRTGDNPVSRISKILNDHCTDVMKMFLKLGLEVTQTDNDGISLVHCAASTEMIKILQLLLEHCEEEFVNKKDRFGSTALHYAVFANCSEAAQCLLEKGCQRDIKDDKGRTAGDLAKLLGYGKLLHQLKGATVSLDPDIFDCKDEYRVNRKPAPAHIDYSELTDMMKAKFGQTTIEAVYTSLLKSPVLGSKEYQVECFRQEAQFVKEEMMSLMTKLSEQHGKQFPEFAFEPRLRGSMAEGTKCGPPDEFDFMLIMNTLSECSQLKAIDNCKAELVTKDGSLLKPMNISMSLILSLKRVVSKSTLWDASTLKFVNLEHTKVGGGLHLVFTGHFYKNLHISVDLVPCIPLGKQATAEMKLDWPYPLDFSLCQLYGLFRDGYDNFDLSSTDYEEVLLNSLPSAAKDAYVLGKAFGSPYFNWCGSEFRDIFKSSYTMKKALLLSTRKHADMQHVSRHSWIEGMIFTLNNMNDYVKENECRRCIFHSEKWNRGKDAFIKLSGV